MSEQASAAAFGRMAHGEGKGARLIRGLHRAVTRATKLYVVKRTLEQEHAEEDRWLARNAVARAKPSTSVVPWRCRCGEWCDATRDRCRVCHQARASGQTSDL